jgi:hypothetical protein
MCEWKDVIGFEDRYSISEYGDVYNKELNLMMKPYISNKGYKVVDLSKNGKKYKFLIHRLVAIHFVPNPENYPIVLHKDNNKLNIHYSNLKWGTYSENNAQAIADGLNKVPRPDNRRWYKVYDDNGNSISCYGINKIIEENGWGTESNIRNYVFRGTKISQGNYAGFRIKNEELESPITFIKKR